MGQQQLLLVILVTILVGIATVVAINVFGSSAETANRDAVRQDILTIGASAQGFFIKPTMMAGGGNSFTGITFNELSFPANVVNANGLEAANENGSYKLVVGGTNDVELTVTAYPSSDGAYSGNASLYSATADEPIIATITAQSIAFGSN